uniref:Uncharacterized protein n=1 Tax=Timema poppense TaxID=170557 RepID=A0A7R9CSS0_TIMPO|nr:unnamed protein product [Timema poppensis]
MSRKRKRRPDEWKRNVAKKDRHRPKGFPSMPTCVHGQNSIFKCKELSMQDVRKIHQHYYKDANLQSKKNFILQHVTVSSVQRN